jgi:hypothetical protein
MPQRESYIYADPLDVLRRFVPTPLKALYRVGEFRVMVQTNDITLVPMMLLGADLSASDGWDWEWKLVRDADVSGELEPPLLLRSKEHTVVAIGTACLVGVDHERRELLAFVGSGVDANAHQHFLVPLFCRMLNGETPTELTIAHDGFQTGLAND